MNEWMDTKYSDKRQGGGGCGGMPNAKLLSTANITTPCKISAPEILF